ncbi:MAG: NAD-dependent epimerase/dehydratase family protein [Salinivirgaceae bacterium]|nr:NAD-dependent epimerase/dehydratase family protein [Salinivirgaceae bacterium]
MIKVGITGQTGFIGTHLFNRLNLLKDKFLTIPFEDSYFENQAILENFVIQCDVIVHLAAMNRHNDPEVIYSTNLRLVQQLVDACEKTNTKPHLLFSSSTQEERDNLYGKSKKEGRRLFEKWANKNSAQFSGFIIPNVFGPFGKPYYNSVVATFCHQLTHEEQPKLDVDGELCLIFVHELVKHFIDRIELNWNENRNKCVIEEILVSHTSKAKVSTILGILETYKTKYLEKGEIPELDNPFKRNLFNTFLCYIDHASFFPFLLKKNIDNRGSFVETVKLNSGGQISFSTTVPGVTRGNHFHTRKAERFVVIKGKAKIEIRRIGTDKILSFELNGSQPSFVDMPIWFTHNITNIGDEDLYTMFWINEHHVQEDADTFYTEV